MIRTQPEPATPPLEPYSQKPSKGPTTATRAAILRRNLDEWRQLRNTRWLIERHSHHSRAQMHQAVPLLPAGGGLI